MNTPDFRLLETRMKADSDYLVICEILLPDQPQLNAFTITRQLTMALCTYQGWLAWCITHPEAAVRFELRECKDLLHSHHRNSEWLDRPMIHEFLIQNFPENI